MIDSNIKLQINKALQIHQAGDLQQAEGLYRALINQNVQVPVIFTQLALICSMNGRNEEAKQLASLSLKLKPEFVDGLLRLGDILRAERNFPAAIELYHRVLKQNPNIAVVYLHISFCLLQLGELGKALSACNTVLKVEKSNIHALRLVAQILTAKGALAEAEQAYLKLLSINSNDIDATYGIANLCKSRGDMERAKVLYLSVIKSAPMFINAHYSFSAIHKYKDINEVQIQQMQSQLNSAACSDDNQILLCFALAKAFEDCGEFSKAFEYLEQGNNLRFARFNYDIRTDEDFINSIIDGFSKPAVANVINDTESLVSSSKKPIFIVGMPRSGTSLAEKILATHSDVHGGGELEYFFKLGTSLFLDQSTDFLYKNIDQYEVEKFSLIAQTYLKQLEKLNHKAEFITDKLPFNMLLIGLIKITFPNALIIHCKRDPIDNCLSIYKQNFTTDNYRFAYNLTTLGKFYQLSDKLMEHWSDLFGDSIYTLQYEELIAKPNQVIRSLINRCGLDWQEECLNFHQSKAVVTTASAYQVRQPIYKSSVALWKKYQPNLDPLLQALNWSKEN